MKILSMYIENYKTISLIEEEVNGKNINTAGNTGMGKTTLISALWDIIEKVGTPLKYGETGGKIRIVIGDGNTKVFAERKFTEKSNVVSITTSEGGKLSVSEFKAWFSSLCKDPHKILEMAPLQQTEMLLKSVEMPKGFDLQKVNEEIFETESKRTDQFRVADTAKKRFSLVEPEKAERVSAKVLFDERDAIVKRGLYYDEKIESLSKANTDLSTIIDNINSLKLMIKQKTEEMESKALNKKTLQGEIMEMGDDYSTIKVDEKIDAIDETNKKADIHAQWVIDKDDAKIQETKYKELDVKVVDLQKQKKEAVENAKWPIKGLSVEDGKIMYFEVPLVNCGTSEKLLICGALAAESISAQAKINPNTIEVVRMDAIEQMSKADFKALEKIFNEKGIQVFSSRVSRDGDAEDGEILIQEGEIVNK